MPMVTGETTTVAGSRVFVDAMLAHNTQFQAEIERAAAGLAGAGITGPVLDGLHELREHYAGAGARWEALGAALKEHEALAELVRATLGAATDLTFYTDDSSAAGGTHTGRAAGGGDGEIRPQWPGHKPPRRWEWGAVSAHQPGDPDHVNYALPSIDLPSEQALRAYVQDALQRYDLIKLHHWYSGSELTFTRRPDGSVHVSKRQLNPTPGAPGHRRDF